MYMHIVYINFIRGEISEQRQARFNWTGEIMNGTGRKEGRRRKLSTNGKGQGSCSPKVFFHEEKASRCFG